MRYLAVNTEGYVVNIIVWDGTTPYIHPEITLYNCDVFPEVTYGWQYVNGVWIPPPTSEEEII